MAASSAAVLDYDDATLRSTHTRVIPAAATAGRRVLVTVVIGSGSRNVSAILTHADSTTRTLALLAPKASVAGHASYVWEFAADSKTAGASLALAIVLSSDGVTASSERASITVVVLDGVNAPHLFASAATSTGGTTKTVPQVTPTVADTVPLLIASDTEGGTAPTTPTTLWTVPSGTSQLVDDHPPTTSVPVPTHVVAGAFGSTLAAGTASPAYVFTADNAAIGSTWTILYPVTSAAAPAVVAQASVVTASAYNDATARVTHSRVMPAQATAGRRALVAMTIASGSRVLTATLKHADATTRTLPELAPKASLTNGGHAQYLLDFLCDAKTAGATLELYQRPADPALADSAIKASIPLVILDGVGAPNAFATESASTGSTIKTTPQVTPTISNTVEVSVVSDSRGGTSPVTTTTVWTPPSGFALAVADYMAGTTSAPVSTSAVAARMGTLLPANEPAGGRDWKSDVANVGASWTVLYPNLSGSVASGLYAVTVDGYVALELVFSVHTGTSPAGVRYVAPTAQGTGDGSTFDNAAGGLASIPGLMSGGGTDIRLRTDLGDYTAATVSFTAGGTQAVPVVIRGVAADGTTAAKAQIIGTRVTPYDVAFADSGSDTFRFNAGSNWITMRDLRLRNVEECFSFCAPATGFVIERCDGTNVRRFIENKLQTSTAPASSVTNVRVRHCIVRGFSKQAARFRYDSSDIVIEKLYGDSERQDGDNFCMGVFFDHTAHDIQVIDSEMHNCIQTMIGTTPRASTDYWNGDGFVCERGNYNLTYTRCKASGSTDGGFDLKGPKTGGKLTLVDCEAWGNKRNYRVHDVSDAVFTRCHARNPVKEGGSGVSCSVWLSPPGTAIAPGGATFTDSNFTDQLHNRPLFALEQDSRLTVNGGTLTLWPDGVIKQSEGSPNTYEQSATTLVVRKDPTRAAEFATWDAATSTASSAPARVLCIGDSTTEGQGSTLLSERWMEKLAVKLRTKFPASGVTYSPNNYYPIKFVSPSIAAENKWAIGAAPSFPNNFGLGTRVVILNTVDETAALTFTGTRAVLSYTRTSTATTWRWRVDAGAWNNVVTSGSQTGGIKVDTGLYAAGQHVVDVEWVSGGDLYLGGAFAYHGDFDKGVQIFDGGHHGVRSGTVFGGSATQWQQEITAVNPHLVLINYGINDYSGNVLPATYKTNMEGIISRIKAGLATAPTIVLMAPYQRTGTFTYPWSEYVTALKQIADADAQCVILDLGAQMPPVSDTTSGLYASDKVHLSPLGNTKYADLIYGLLVPT